MIDVGRDHSEIYEREIMNMAAIHLIKNDRSLPQIIPIAQGSDIFRSGYWLMAEDTAKALVGGNIFFHKRQAESSFFGRLRSFFIKWIAAIFIISLSYISE